MFLTPTSAFSILQDNISDESSTPHVSSHAERRHRLDVYDCTMRAKEMQPFLLLLAFSFNKADGDVRLEDVMNHIFTNCQVKTVAILSDNGDVDDFSWKKAVLTVITASSKSVLFTHYDYIEKAVTTDLYNIIHHLSHEQVTKPTLFLLMTTRFAEVIALAEEYFDQEGRQRGSILLHSFKWLVCVTSTQNQSYSHDIDEYLRNSSFDNVAFVQVDRDAVGDYFVSHATTLMWREHDKAREIDIIDLSRGIANPSICPLFPNTRNQLNGRRLKIITKTHGGFWVMIRNNSNTGIPEYHGLLIDIFNSLAFALNFTYSLDPEPIHESQVSWENLRYDISMGEYDIGMALLSDTWNTQFNLTITNTILPDSLTGLFLNDIANEETDFILVLCPFSPFILLLLLGSYIVTTLMYFFIVGIVYPHEDAENLRDIQYINMCDKKKTPVRPFLRDVVPVQLRKRAWTILVSIINQAYLPRPKQMSARSLLFLWSLSVIMFYAIYTGSLTAAMVVRKNNVPFETFQEMMDSGDFRWGTIDGSYPDTILKSAESDLAKTIYENRDNFPASNYMNDYESLKRKIESLESKYVVIHSENLLRHIQSNTEHPEEYSLMKEPIFTCDHGLGVPKNSELGQLISDYINILKDTGLVSLFHNSYLGVRLEGGTNQNNERRPVNINDIRAPIYVAGALLVVSVLILCWEKLQK